MYYIDENIGELYFSVMGFLHTIRDQQEDTAMVETVAADIQDVVNRQTCRPCFKMFGMCYNTTHSLCRICYYATALIILESIS